MLGVQIAAAPTSDTRVRRLLDKRTAVYVEAHYTHHTHTHCSATTHNVTRTTAPAGGPRRSESAGGRRRGHDRQREHGAAAGGMEDLLRRRDRAVVGGGVAAGVEVAIEAREVRRRDLPPR